MIITCTECQTRFRLADEKLKPSGTKVRCSVCQHIFTVLPPAAAPAEEAITAGDFGSLEQTPPPAAAAAEPSPAEARTAAPSAADFIETAGAGYGDSANTVGPAEEPGSAKEPDALGCAEGTDEDADQFDFGEQPEAAEGITSFGFDEAPSTADAPVAEPTFGDEWAASWEQPEADGSAFDFDAPSFETGTATTEITRGDAGLSFDEIEFSRPVGSDTAGIATPLEQAGAAPVPATPAPPIARPLPSRPRSEELLPPPARRQQGRNLFVLVLLLLILCGIGGYFYFAADGRQMFERLLTRVTGNEPAAPVEQRIGLGIASSNYVTNQEAGQLLVIQGSAINHFASARSAITVKGVIQDAAGKVLQQQTVFCGNYLDEEQLRTLKYVQIEEAMNNQFGNSLSNMNIKPGSAIPFTIVFRNVPKELANINVEVVDSKPGGL